MSTQNQTQAAPQLAATDSVNVSIQPFMTEEEKIVYHGNISFLDSQDKQQYITLQANEPLLLINMINDALRSKEISLSRVSGEIPPLPPQEEPAST